jgi:hypothetical protein
VNTLGFSVATTPWCGADGGVRNVETLNQIRARRGADAMILLTP